MENTYPVINVHIHSIDLPIQIKSKNHKHHSLSSSISPPTFNTKNEGPIFKTDDIDSISWSFEHTLNSEFNYPYWQITIYLHSHYYVHLFPDIYQCTLNISDLVRDNKKYIEPFWIEMVDLSNRKSGIKIQVSFSLTFNINYYGRYIYNLKDNFDLDITMNDILYFINKTRPHIYSLIDKMKDSKSILDYFMMLLPSTLPKIESKQSEKKKKIKIPTDSLSYDWAIINDDDNLDIISFDLKIDDLHDELLCEIFDYCDEKTKGSILFVSKKWNRLLINHVKSSFLKGIINVYHYCERNNRKPMMIDSMKLLKVKLESFKLILDISNELLGCINIDDDILYVMYIFICYIEYLEIFIKIQYRWSSFSTIKLNLFTSEEYQEIFSNDLFNNHFMKLTQKLTEHNWLDTHILSTCRKIMEKKLVKTVQQMGLFTKISVFALSIVNASQQKSFKTKNYRYVLDKIKEEYKDHVTLNDWKIFLDSYNRWGGLQQ